VGTAIPYPKAETTEGPHDNPGSQGDDEEKPEKFVTHGDGLVHFLNHV